MVQSGKLLKHYNSFILLLLVLVVSDVALAQSQQQSVSQPQLYKVGESQLKVFLVKVFRSRLYSDNGKINDQTQWIHLQLTYQRNFKARQLVSQTDKEWQKQGYDNTKRSQWLEYINQLWPNVNKGDQISFQYNQHSGESRFFFCSKKTINNCSSEALEGNVRNLYWSFSRSPASRNRRQLSKLTLLTRKT